MNMIHFTHRSPSIVFTLLLCVQLSGCSSFLAATHNGPVEQDPGQRTLGEVLDDNQIITHAKVNIAKADPALDKANINIASYNGVVLLTGEVRNNQLRDMAGDIARDVNSVRQVHNQLTIAPKATFYSRTNDNWIDTKIRTKLLTSKVVESNRVKLVVENRVVYIMGLLTEAEAQGVTELASTTEGVTKVVRAIELVPDHERAPL